MLTAQLELSRPMLLLLLLLMLPMLLPMLASLLRVLAIFSFFRVFVSRTFVPAFLLFLVHIYRTQGWVEQYQLISQT